MKKSKKLLLLFFVGAMILHSTGCGCEHDFSEWTVKTKSTCTEKGVEVRTCSLCEEVEEREIELAEHSYKQWRVKKEATCSEKGTMVQFCSMCNIEGKEKETNKKNHSYDNGTILTEATCTEKGSKKVTCKSCGITETKDISATGHTYGEWENLTVPTCAVQGTKKRICKICGNVEESTIPTTEHKYVIGTCSECGSADPNFNAIVVNKESGYPVFVNDSNLTVEVINMVSTGQDSQFHFKCSAENFTNKSYYLAMRNVVTNNGVYLGGGTTTEIPAGLKSAPYTYFDDNEVEDIGAEDWSYVEADVVISDDWFSHNILYTIHVVIYRSVYY